MKGARSVRDVVVGGAGPAGALLAYLCARRGLDVLLVDRIRRPAHKVCGCCLNAAARAVLARAGLPAGPGGGGGRELRRLELCVAGRCAEIPLRGGVAWSRRAMDATLLHAAQSAGAEVREGVRARLAEPGSGHGGGPAPWRHLMLDAPGVAGRVRARVVVDAAGLAGLGAGGMRHPSVEVPGSPVGVGAVFGDAGGRVDSGVIRMYAGRGGYVGMVRLEDGRLNVAAALAPDALRRAGGPGPAVARLLEVSGAPPLPPTPEWGWRGTRPLTRRARRVAGYRLFRVGDAAGYVEPFTGEGMAWALAGAWHLAPLVAKAAASAVWPREAEDAWQARWEEAWRSGTRLCHAAAWTLRKPVLARGAVALARAAPRVAERLAAGAGRAPWMAAAP